MFTQCEQALKTFDVNAGFVRDRVVRALERTGNDVQAATLMLLQENDG